MSDRPTIRECLGKLRNKAQSREMSDCLFRGEAALYPATHSSHHRLFSVSRRFTDDQANAVKERLVTIAQMLDIVGLGRPVFASADEASKHAKPTTWKETNEVIYCFMQHYHLATPFIDLTTDIDIGAAFATFGAAQEESSSRRQGVIYLISKKELERHDLRITQSVDSRARRPKAQKAVSLFLERDTDFQRLPDGIVERFEFDDTSEVLAPYDRPEVYDAAGDFIAQQVAHLAYRCAYDDLASNDPSHGRVSEYFSEIAYLLADAGAVPKA